MTTVGVVGLGYVGLPLAVAFASEGCDVIALDVDGRKTDAIAAGKSYIEDVSDDALQAVAERVHTTTRYACLAKADAIIVCVPTPLTRNREPELSPLTSAMSAVAGVLQAGQLVVLESTTYPGTTRDRVAPLLEESGLLVGRDFHLAFSPERVDPGRTDYTLRTTPKVLGGITEACATRAEELYGHICDDLVHVSSPEAAELTKLLENIFRSVNIALVNELAMLTDRMGIDIWEVVDAAATKPYGFMRFDPGPGMGGHCLPVDPFYLSWRAREFGMTTEFIELAGKVNQQMPRHCVAKAQRALNDAGMSVKGARVAIIGVSYKAGVGDVRESPAIQIISLLRELGAEIVYHDPFVAALPDFELQNTPLGDALGDADLALIVTAHPDVDHSIIIERARVVVDLRGATRNLAAQSVVSLEITLGWHSDSAHATAPTDSTTASRTTRAGSRRARLGHVPRCRDRRLALSLERALRRRAPGRIPLGHLMCPDPAVRDRRPRRRPCKVHPGLAGIRELGARSARARPDDRTSRGVVCGHGILRCDRPSHRTRQQSRQR